MLRLHEVVESGSMTDRHRLARIVATLVSVCLGAWRGRNAGCGWRLGKPLCACVILLALPATGANEKHIVLEALQAELQRSMTVLGKEPVPPYFLSYEVTEQDTASVSASFGKLTHSSRKRRRFLDIDLRVGDYALDNSRQLRGVRNRARRSYAWVPLDDAADAIRNVAWLETDRRYKRALEQFTKVQTDVEVKVDAEDRSGDFSLAKPRKDIGEVAQLSVDRAVWEAKVRRYTAPFAAHDNIYGASANLSAVAETRWFVNSDGAYIQTGETRYRLSIDAYVMAEDGMRLPRYETFMAYTQAGLPDDDAVQQTVARMIADLQALREAPLADPYAGPAILSGRAAGVFFHEILGHRIEGHRQKGEDEGQTFKSKIDERILPAGFTVTFDPTRRRLENIDLAGAYRYDNQGVPARTVAVVEDGVLKRFLMSRTPIDGFPHSNGHGRKEVGYPVVARQSNLIVEVAAPVSRAELKDRLMAAVREQNKPFGLLFDDIQGGFTSTGRYTPNAFNVQPILVYQVYPDGREELVRGVDLIGTPLTTLSRIVAASDEVAVFNGTCGAESGGVPVSAVSPAILVSQIEVQKKDKSQNRPPLLPPPAAEQKSGDQE